jgi:5'-nucleotidase
LFLPLALIAILPLVFVACFAATDAARENELHITILHTNDIHAHDEPLVEHGHEIGGLARLGHMIRTFKKREPEALVIDAGDMFQGTPLYTTYHGEVEVALLNMIGYNISTIGNHEFDDGPKNLAKQLANAKFKIINCNMDCSKEPELAALISPYIIKEIDGQKVAFIGAVTPDLNQIALNTGGVRVTATGDSWMKPIEEQIAAVKGQGINKIILVTHVGVELDKQLATLPDVDVIVGGHSHTRLDKPIQVTHPDGSTAIIVQTGCFTRALGKLELTFDNKGFLVLPKTDYRLINITDKIFEDKDITAYLTEKVKPLLPLRTTILGTAQGSFENTFRTMPWDSALGDVICDSLAEAGESYGVQISFENRGGIRGRIESGPISLETVDELLPFDNKPVFATIPGDCLLNLLEHSVAGGLGGPFLDEHGLKVAYDPHKEKGHRILFALVEKSPGQWQPVKSDEQYKIAINDYSFNGGEGYDLKCATNVVREPERLSEVFKKYLEHHHVIIPAQHERLVPVTGKLLSVSGSGSSSTLHVAGASPEAKLIFLSGDQQGVTTSTVGIPVPLSHPHIVGTGRCDSSGTCDWPLSSAKFNSNRSANEMISVIESPAKGTTKPTAISYPVRINW